MSIAEAGGPTTQAGISFQNAVATLYLGKMLDPRLSVDSNKVVEVRVEAPEDVDDIVVTYANGKVVYFQVKESVSKSNSKDSAWGKVWADFEKQFNRATFKVGQDKLLLLSGSNTDEIEKAKNLTERASTSRNYSEWENRIGKNLTTFLKHLKSFLSTELINDKKKLLSFFASIEVEYSSRKFIEGERMVSVMPESNQTPSALFSLLRDRVGGEARLRGTHTVENLQEWLQENDIVISKSVSTEELRSAIYSNNSIMRHQPNTIGKTGIHLKRNTSIQITKWLLETTDHENVGVLLDQAGTGKTVLMRDILEDLERQQIDVLTIKADQQLTGLDNLDHLQAKLSLPVRVERLATTLASHKPFIVLIDQMDALSLSMAHDHQALNLALNLISRLRSIPGVRILISCRKFDFDSDPRLQNLEGCKQFHLHEFSDEEIQKCLESTELDYNLLLPSTKKLLRTPLHLNLFLLGYESAENKASLQDRGFTSLQELYHLVWDNVVVRQKPDAPPTWERADALIRMAEYMDHEQKISVPKSFFNKKDTGIYEKAVQWLSSEGIIVREGNEIGFFHQTFFDYCYARNFVDKKLSLVETLLDSPQGLFQRPQLVQVLSYLRGSSDEGAYLKQLTTLFQTKDLRYHLKNHLFRWFASVSSPTVNEKRLIDRLSKDSNVRDQLLQFSFGNPDWFDYWRDSTLKGWLDQSQEEGLEKAFRYLYSVVESLQKEVIDFVKPYYNKNTIMDQAIENLILSIHTWKCNESVELLEIIVRKVGLSTRRNYFGWKELAKYDPRAVCRILRFLMDQALENYKLKKQEQNQNANDAFRFRFVSLKDELNHINHTFLKEALEFVVQSSALYFLDTMIPWLIDATQTLGYPGSDDDQHFKYDRLFDHWYDRSYVRFDDVLNDFLVRAFVKLALEQREAFMEKIERLSNCPYQSMQFLVPRVLRDVPEEYASESLKFLLEDSRRLTIGKPDNFESRQLIKSIVPFLQESQRLELEDLILTKTPLHKDWKLDGYELHQKWQLGLLQSFLFETLSKKARAYLQQLERRFPGYHASDNPRQIEGGWVGPPIASESADKMSDQQWFLAMKKYQGSVVHQKDWLKGGASELSRLLQESVKKEPQRFYDLFNRCQEQLDHHYICALLNGLAESDAPATLLFKAIERYESHENQNVRWTIARAVDKRSEEEIPPRIISLLKTYLDDQFLYESEQKEEPISRYLNTIRGAAMQALMRVYSHQENKHLHDKWATLCYATQSDMIPLRAGAIFELTYMIRHDRQRALDLFERAISGFPELYHMLDTKNFCYWAMGKPFKCLIPHILGLMNDEEEETQQRGAELVAISLISPNLFEDAEVQEKMEGLFLEAMTGPTPHKRGIARILANNLLNSPCPIIFRGLNQLMNDDDAEVQEHVGCFLFDITKEEGQGLTQTVREFITTFAGSKSAVRGGHNLGTVLWEQSLDDPEWTLSVLNRLLTNEYIQSNKFNLDAKDLVHAVINIYTDPLSEYLQSQAMDTFDRLMELYSFQAQAVLDEWDRR